MKLSRKARFPKSAYIWASLRQLAVFYILASDLFLRISDQRVCPFLNRQAVRIMVGLRVKLCKNYRSVRITCLRERSESEITLRHPRSLITTTRIESNRRTEAPEEIIGQDPITTPSLSPPQHIERRNLKHTAKIKFKIELIIIKIVQK